mgnify:CR=1 FL=1
MKLIAELENGNIVEGESIIPDEVVKQKSKIKERPFRGALGF